MAHTNAPAQGNGVPSQATTKASIDARRSWSGLAGAAAAPAPAPPPSHPICISAHSGAGAAGGGAAQRGRSPGAKTPGATSTSATWAAPASHVAVAFAPWRRQHAWNLHQHCTLVQVPLILNRLKRMLPKEFILVWQHRNYFWLIVRIFLKKTCVLPQTDSLISLRQD